MTLGLLSVSAPYEILWIRAYSSLAALDVYVRRAYKAYSLLSIDHEEGDDLDDGDNPNVVTWRFNLGSSRSPPSTPTLNPRE